MKNLSNEELVQQYFEACEEFNYNDGQIETVTLLAQELLRRLEHGDRAIKACREIAAMEIEEGKG